jgi:hypothetical protein
MNLPHYNYKTNNRFLDFEFTSEGPAGAVKKVVRYSRVATNVFNLGFGDLDPETGEISDSVVTNNKDSEKVLITVAVTAVAFSHKYPDALVFAKGSSPARTRLFRRAITNHWDEITNLFEIYGLINGKWQLFKKGKDYEAFLARRK